VIHLFSWNTQAVQVDPDGQRRGEKFRLGAYTCTMCAVLMEFAVKYDTCGPVTCPGKTATIST
jgi:hypothetical protein